MMISNRVRAAGATLAIGLVGAVFYLGSAGQGFTPGVTLPIACSSGDFPQWDGAAWQCRTVNDLRGKHFEFKDDFLNPQANDWLGNATSGTGASATATQASSVRPGILELDTGTTTTGLGRWFGPNATAIDFSSNSSTAFDLVAAWPTLSTVTDEYESIIGFGNFTTNVNQTDGCYFLEDRLPVATAPATGTITAGSTNLQCWCASGSTRTGYTMDGSIVSQGGFTTVATPIAAGGVPNSNFYRMRVVVLGTSEADFYVDSGLGLTKRCVITSNIPSGSKVNYSFSILKSAGTTTRAMYVDYAALTIDQLVARSL